MGVWEASDAVHRAVPGSVKAMDIYGGAGAVFSESWSREGGVLYHACWVELFEREAEGADDGELAARVLSDECYASEGEGRRGYEKLARTMPRRPKERPPEDATPEERAEWEADVARAREEIERLGRLIAENPGVPLEEIDP